MTTIFHQKYEEVTYQIDVCCDKGAMVLTSTLTGRWNETQTIVLRDEHVQAIDHMWATLETSGKAKTYSIADSLDQDQPSFEIVHITYIEQRAYLFRASHVGIENCVLRMTGLRQAIDSYQSQRLCLGEN